MKKSKKSISIIIASIMLVLLIGISYSFFIYDKQGENRVAVGGGIYLTLTEEELGVYNLYPMSDEDGINSGVKYNFSIEGVNESQQDLYYGIYINKGEEISGKTRFADEDIRLYLTQTIGENTVAVYGPASLKEFNDTLIYSDTIMATTSKDSPVDVDYQLTMWVSDKVLISDTETEVEGYRVYSLFDYDNMYSTVKIGVKGDFSEKYVYLDVSSSGRLATSATAYDVNKSYSELNYATENVIVTLNSIKEIEKFIVTDAVNNTTNEYAVTLVDGKYQTEIEYSTSGSYVYYGLASDGSTSNVSGFNVKIDEVAPSFTMSDGGTYNAGSLKSYYRIENTVTNISDDNNYVLGYALVPEGETPSHYTEVNVGDTYQVVVNAQTGIYDLVIRVVDAAGKETIERKKYVISYNIDLVNERDNVTVEKTSMEVVKGQKYGYIESLPMLDYSYFFGYSTDAFGNKIISNDIIVGENVERLYLSWDNGVIVAIAPTAENYCASLTYNGESQNIVAATGVGYTFSNNIQTDAGSYDVTATLNSGYTWDDGTTGVKTITCSIEKRNVTYTSGSSSKEYNGTALTNNTATLTSGSLVSGHTATVTTSGSQTAVGSSNNTISSVVIKDASGNDVTNNYSITKVSGTLTVSDTTKPSCSVSIASTTLYRQADAGQNETTVTFSCTDTSGVTSKTLSSSNFSVSSSALSISSVSGPTAITNGYKWVVTVKGSSSGSAYVTLKANQIYDNNNNGNNATNSETITIKTCTYRYKLSLTCASTSTSASYTSGYSYSSVSAARSACNSKSLCTDGSDTNRSCTVNQSCS